MSIYCPNCRSDKVDWERAGIRWYAFQCETCGKKWLMELEEEP